MAHSPIFRAFACTLQRARRENMEAEGAALPDPADGAGWSRRRFLSAALKATVATAAAGTVGELEAAVRGTRWRAGPASGAVAGGGPRIAIIGAGLAGLSAALRLREQGLDATVYEARAGAGGRIRSVAGPVGDGLVVEMGAELVDSNHADLLSLAGDLGVTLSRRTAAGTGVPDTAWYFGGRARPEEEVAHALRPLALQIAEDAARCDSDLGGQSELFDRMTVAQYLDAHAGAVSEPFVRQLVENAVRAEMGAEPGQTSVLHLLFLLPTVDGTAVDVLGASDEAFVLTGGSSRLTDALVERLSGRIRTRKALRSVEEDGGVYRLRFEDGTRVSAEHVIFALPFAVLRDVELQVPLPALLRRMIHELDAGSNEKIIAGFRSRPWRRREGFAKEAWADVGFTEMWDATLRQSERADGAMTFFYGGDQVAAMRQGSARDRGREVVDRVDRILPGWSEAAADLWVRTAWGESRFSRGAYVTFRPGQYTEFAEHLWFEPDDPAEFRAVRAGNLHFAGEHVSGDFYGFMNGAAQTGRLAAEEAARTILAPADGAAR